jgi:hypothetical protein
VGVGRGRQGGGSILSCFDGKEWRQGRLERWEEQGIASVLIGLSAYIKMLRGYIVGRTLVCQSSNSGSIIFSGNSDHLLYYVQNRDPQHRAHPSIPPYRIPLTSSDPPLVVAYSCLQQNAGVTWYSR